MSRTYLEQRRFFYYR